MTNTRKNVVRKLAESDISKLQKAAYFVMKKGAPIKPNPVAKTKGAYIAVPPVWESRWQPKGRLDLAIGLKWFCENVRNDDVPKFWNRIKQLAHESTLRKAGLLRVLTENFDTILPRNSQQPVTSQMAREATPPSVFDPDWTPVGPESLAAAAYHVALNLERGDVGKFWNGFSSAISDYTTIGLEIDPEHMFESVKRIVREAPKDPDELRFSEYEEDPKKAPAKKPAPVNNDAEMIKTMAATLETSDVTIKNELNRIFAKMFIQTGGSLSAEKVDDYVTTFKLLQDKVVNVILDVFEAELDKLPDAKEDESNIDAKFGGKNTEFMQQMTADINLDEMVREYENDPSIFKERIYEVARYMVASRINATLPEVASEIDTALTRLLGKYEGLSEVITSNNPQQKTKSRVFRDKVDITTKLWPIFNTLSNEVGGSQKALVSLMADKIGELIDKRVEGTSHEGVVENADMRKDLLKFSKDVVEFMANDADQIIWSEVSASLKEMLSKKAEVLRMTNKYYIELADTGTIA